MSIPFAKMHGAGNDFVVLDARALTLDWGTLAKSICDRHLGVGADQLILVLPSEIGDLRMGIYNADGSEAEMCGNGIRCIAKFALERGIAPWTDEALRVETPAGVLPVSPLMESGKLAGARVGMGKPGLRPQEIPVDLAYSPTPASSNGNALDPYDETVLDWPISIETYSPTSRSITRHDLRVTGVSMGNPHAVAFLETPVDEFPLEQVGPQIEHHPMFPKRVNFEIVNVLGKDRMRARVWERGAGLTLACGSGACAITVAARLHGYTNDTIQLELPGGILQMAWDGQNDVIMEGPAEEVFSAEWTNS